MFQDGEVECVSVPSTWKVEEIEHRHSATQTSVILADDKEVQLPERCHVEVQTDSMDNSAQLAVNSQDIDAPKVLEFLNRVYPLISEQLQDSISTHAFHDYDVDWSEDFGGLACIHTLEESIMSSQTGVSGVSWSSTGSTVAVAYGRLDHEHLCTHKGGVCTWNIESQALNVNKADVILDCMSCVMCVAFHPSMPALLCAGTYNGDVFVWDLSRAGEKLCFSNSSDDAHQDPISSIVWTVEVSNRGKKYQIQSAGTDGLILTWSLPVSAASSSYLELVAGHALCSNSVPRSLKGGASSRSTGQFGASSVSFSSFDRRQFVVGCDSGNIFKCNLGLVHHSSAIKGLRSPDSAVAIGKQHGGSIAGDAQLKSPISFTFMPLKGPVYGVDCSPFHRNAFLAGGSDGCLHVYSVLQNRPVFSADPSHGYIFCSRWSPARPLVCAVGTADGHILVYDFQASEVQPALTLDGDTKKAGVVSLEFCPKRPQYIVCGNASGQALVYRLPSEFSRPVKGEDSRLKSLIEI